VLGAKVKMKIDKEDLKAVKVLREDEI